MAITRPGSYLAVVSARRPTKQAAHNAANAKHCANKLDPATGQKNSMRVQISDTVRNASSAQSIDLTVIN